MASYPAPTVPRPTQKQLVKMLKDAALDRAVSFKTSDGCKVEPDGVCQHGHPTWLRRFGLI